MANIFSFGKKSSEKPGEIGFGESFIDTRNRLINKDGTFNVIRKGKMSWTPYQDLIEMGWLRFFFINIIFYTLVNSFFAGMYLAVDAKLDPSNMDESLIERFLTALFFSVQTFTTVGYGYLHPMGNIENIIAGLNAFAGWLSFAIITGLFFARFSKPQARIIFSKQCIVTPFNGGKALMVRIANLRNNRITDVEVRMTMTYVENTTGRLTRKYIELPLQLDRVVTLPLNWTIVHKIDEISPLKGHDKESLKALRPEILLFIKAYDETYAQQVYANSSYVYNDIEWGVRFKTMYEAGHRGTILHLDQINTTEPIDPAPEEEN